MMFKVPECRDSSFDPIFQELSSRCDGDGYTRADKTDIARWAGARDVRVPVFIDQMGAELAKRYHAKLVDYAFGDSLANDVWGVMILGLPKEGDHEDWSAIFCEVYEAFDAGEFHRPGDEDADPVKLYTDPAIAEIVAKLPNAP